MFNLAFGIGSATVSLHHEFNLNLGVMPHEADVGSSNLSFLLRCCQLLKIDK